MPSGHDSLAEEVGGSVAEDLAALSAEAELIVLGVKPAALDAVAAELKPAAVLSMLAATSLARLSEAFPETPVMRLMPSQPVEVRHGVLCHAPPLNMGDELAAELGELLGALGMVVELPEEKIDAAMAVMACSPAYVALVADALSGAGVDEGLDPALSQLLVAETLAGTAALLGKRDGASIRRAVAPPGGATEAGLDALESAGVPAALAAAVQASLERVR